MDNFYGSSGMYIVYDLKIEIRDYDKKKITFKLMGQLCAS